MPTEFLQAYLGATDEQRAAALDALQGRTAAGLADNTPIDRVLSVDTVCQMCNLSKASLRSYAQQGRIKRACFATGKRCWGYTESSVREFLKRAAQG